MFNRNNDLIRILLKRFRRIKEELDEHLQSINENTNEIQANYEYLNKIDEKINKVNEKIEILRLQIEALAKQTDKDIVIRLTPKEQLRLVEFLKKGKELTDFDDDLSKQEKKILMLLYSARAKGRILTYRQIANELGMEEALVAGYSTNLIEKGIPIIKHYRGKEVAIELHTNFRYLDLEKSLHSVMG